MKAKSAKAKGRRLQQEVRDRIHEMYGFEPDTAVMGEKGKDVKDDRLPYSIECKNVEKLNLWKAWQQAKDNLFEGDTPVVVFTKNRPPGQREKEDRLAVVPLDWFLERMEVRAPVWGKGMPAVVRYQQEIRNVQPEGSGEAEDPAGSVLGEGHGRGRTCNEEAGGCVVCRCLESAGWVRPGTRGA